MSEQNRFRWIETKQGLDSLVEELHLRPRIALDTEANGFHAHRPQLCLLQFAWEVGDRVQIALVDSLALGADVGVLVPLLESPGLEKVIHGADYDVRLLKRDLGASLRGLYDTQIAARLIGSKQTGLASLLEERCGKTLDKSQQRIDWAQRPLAQRALDYAAADVADLLRLRDSLSAAVVASGREEWVGECCRRLEREEPRELPAPDGRTLLKKALGAKRLGLDQEKRLASLLLWREQLASSTNQAAFRICDSSLLVAAAQGQPIPAWLQRRYGVEIARELEAAPGLELAEPARAERPAPLDAAQKNRLAALRQARQNIAERLGLEPGVLAPTAILEQLARLPLWTQQIGVEAGLMSWQAGLLDPELAPPDSGAP